MTENQPALDPRASTATNIVMLFGAFATVTAAVLTFLMIYLRTDAIESGEKVLAGFAELVNEQTTRTLQSIEQTLQAAQAILSTAIDAGIVDGDQIRPQFRELLKDRPFLTSILVVDRNGFIVLGREAADTGRNVADRGYFISQRDKPKSELLWGVPIKARSTGQWVVTVTLPIRQPNGDFDGMIVGSVPLAFFDGAWEVGDDIQGLAISLWRTDGMLLMRSPFDERVMGTSTPGMVLFSKLNQGQIKGRFETFSLIDNVRRIVVFRRLDAYPDFILTFTQSTDEALVAWWQAVWMVALGWAASMTTIGGMAVWLTREWRVHRAMENRYRILFDANPYPMLVADRDTLQFLAVNDATVEQYGWSRSELMALTINDLYPPEDLPNVMALRRQYVPGVSQLNKDLRHHKKSGAAIEVETNVRLIDFDGRPALLAMIQDVTSRKAAEEHSVQMEDRYRGLLEAAPDAMVVVNQTGEIVLLNVQAEKQFGYRRDELLGQKVTNIIPEGFAERLVTDATRSATDALAQEIGTGIELSGLRKDGSAFPIEIMLSPLESAEGILVTAAIRNISVRRAAEEQLTQMEGQYRGLLEAAPDAMVVVNQSGEIVLLNVQAEKQFGYRRDELLGQKVTNIIPEGFAERLVTDATRSETDALAQEIGTGIELVGRRRDGSNFPIEIMLSPLESTDGILVTAAIRNISVRKGAEEQLIQMEGQYRGLLEAAPDAMVVVNQAGEIVLLNVQAEKQFGYRRDELLGQQVTNIIPEGFAERLVTDATRSETDALAQEIGTGIELSGQRKDGKAFPIEIMLSPLESTEGILVTAAIRNISVRKAAEKHLTQMEGQYRGLLEAAPDAMVVVNQAGEIVLLNVQAEKQFGYRRDELLGQKVTNIIPEGFAERLVTDATRSETDALAQEIGTGIELSGRSKDGGDFPIEIMLSPLESTDGILVTAAIRNISVRKAAEEQLRQSQKMEAVGQLTGGIAHDFNNILFVILANTDALLEDETFSPSVNDRLGQIDKAVQRASELTRQLLAFSRKQPLRPQQTDLNDLVSDTGQLLRRSLGAQIEIEAVLADDLYVVNVDRSQLETAIVNLCINARDAMPGGGRLLIETKNAILDEEYCIFNPGATPGDYAALSITDAGEGIPSALLGKVFEPFFTTKGIGKGTGLGLSMVYGFIKQSNGHVAIYSEVGRGTTIKLYLPRSAGVAEAPLSRDKTPAPGGVEKILVVEDEPQVRSNVVRQLRSLGYTVSEAHDGTAGIAAFETTPVPYDLLLSDVVMPGPISGKLLAAEVVHRWPDTKVVFMSGFTEISSVRHGRLDEGSLLLSKPFRKADLARMIRHALDAADRKVVDVPVLANDGDRPIARPACARGAASATAGPPESAPPAPPVRSR